MPKKFAVILCLAIPLILLDAAQAQPGPTDAEQTELSPQRRFRGGRRPGVYKARIAPNWFDGNDRFWYRNDLRGGLHEFILVDAIQGERKAAFDHQRLAKVLVNAGMGEVRADRLELEALEFDTKAGTISFRTADKDWQCDLATYELSEVEVRDVDPDRAGAAVPLRDVPRASIRTGPETELHFVNETDRDVELFWLESSGGRRSYGKLAAGKEKRQHTYAGHVWLVIDANGVMLAAFEATQQPSRAVITRRTAQRAQRRRRRRFPGSSASDMSPDGKWRAQVNEGNVFVRRADAKEETQLTTNGSPESGYQMLRWSPDSRALVAFRVEPGDRKEVFLIESSPRGGGRAVLHQRRYALPGDKLASYELNLFRLDQTGEESADIDGQAENRWKAIKPEVEPVDFGRPRIVWSRDGSEFAYVKIDRGHQRFRSVAVDATSGRSRNVIDEQTDTFIWTAHAENVDVRPLYGLEDTNEIIYASEVDGWRHLYLIDPTISTQNEDGEAKPQVVSGKKRLFAPGLKNQITQGQFVVRGIDWIDEKNRQIWFRASGRNADQDPYFIHYYRVNFDGSGLVALTEGNGNHSIQFSPDRRYLIDTYSRVDMPPLHELRRATDGQLVCKLEEADITQLEESGWKPPEVFVAKGRDGITDIWGIISRPRDFDPSKKYPVIEDLYAGPHSAYVPKRFSGRNRYAALNELGYVVVKIDGMGTAHRSKAFHDVCWHNLKDAGFPDRILWMKAAAAKYPSLDLSRVGVYGVSAGGQNAAGAVLFHGDFYQVAVAACGCHDNRMDKASWNEQWMGFPVGPQYSESSNIDNAHRLAGKLLLIVGEMDNNVPPESTLRFVDALIKADKDFDMLLVPGAGHGIGGDYGRRRMHDFFVRHLSDKQAKTQLEPTPLTQSSPGRLETPPKEKIELAALQSVSQPEVMTPPESFFEIVRERDRDAARDFYKKYIDVGGIPVVAAKEVADEALMRTYSIVTHMLAGRPDVVNAMVEDRMYLIIIGKDQVYTDMPENRNARNPEYLNERVRGTGGRPTSFGEENLIGWPIDRYDDESIAVHEFCHTIDRALRRVDPAWHERRNAVYRAAIDNGLWKNTYTASNPGEYWAEIAQTYFDSQRVNNWNHGPIGTREQLKEYDPGGYELVRATFKLGPDQDWRYRWPKKLPNVSKPPATLQIDPYYTKFTWAREFTVLGREASDAALLKANDTIRKMFAYRHDILKALIADGVRLVVLGRDESLADLPEFAGDKRNANVDLLARVLDYAPDTKLLVVAEENVLGDPNDPMVGHNQVIRVFAKALHRLTGTRPLDPDWNNRPRRLRQQYELRVQRLDIRFDERLAQLFEAASDAGRWQGTSAVHDRGSYWTAGVLAYFDAAGQDAAPHDAAHPISTRKALAEYDRQLYALVHESMAYDGRVDWRR